MIKLVLPLLGILYKELHDEQPIWIVVAGESLDDQPANDDDCHANIKVYITTGVEYEDVIASTHFEREPLFLHAVRLSSLLSQAEMMFKIDAMGIDQKLDKE